MRHDRRLMGLLKAGELSGLAGLFDRHGGYSVRRARKAHANNAAADNAVFAGFMLLWRDPPEDGVDIRSWLALKVARHLTRGCH